MATPQQLIEFRKKAVKSPKIGKRGKSQSTLIKEQVIREHFQNNLNVLSELGAEKIKIARLELHKKRPSAAIADVKLRAIESVEDRVLGKSVTKNINANVELPAPIYGGDAS